MVEGDNAILWVDFLGSWHSQFVIWQKRVQIANKRPDDKAQNGQMRDLFTSKVVGLWRRVVVQRWQNLHSLFKVLNKLHLYFYANTIIIAAEINI